MNAEQMSKAIRAKRKKVKEEGLDNMLDTAPGPQMNPQDIYNLKQEAVRKEITDSPDIPEGPSDPADPELGESQKKEMLQRKMARLARILGSLSMG